MYNSLSNNAPPFTQSAAGDKVLRRVDTGNDIEDPSHYSIEDAKHAES